MCTLSNVNLCGGEVQPPSVRLAPDTFPEAKSSKTGVSIRYVNTPDKKWYVFRASYGRVDQASDFLINDGTYVYVAKRYKRKLTNGKMKMVLEPLIPNLLFAYLTEDDAEKYIKETPVISYVTYYYDHCKKDETEKNPPLIIPLREMEMFVRETSNHNEHLRLVNPSQCHFKSGEIVRVIEGTFKGVEGRVARVAGQQRVIVSLSQIGLIATAYIPSAFLERAH